MKHSDFSRFCEIAGSLGVLAVRISQGGELSFHHNWDDDCRRNLYSATKSFTSAAVGIAVGEGLLSLDEKLTEAFPDDLPAAVDENLRKATVRDLLTMCLGQGEAHLMGAERPFIPEDDWVKLALSYPFPYEPGTHFVYNNAGPYLAGVLVERRAGCDLAEYLTPRLFAPLGIRKPTWERDPMGHCFGAGGLFLNLPEFHRFGELCLADGAWEGRQLIPAKYLREATSKQVENGAEGYGYLFWMGKQNTARADGKYCQLSILFREKNAVVSMLSECRRGDQLFDAIYREIGERL